MFGVRAKVRVGSTREREKALLAQNVLRYVGEETGLDLRADHGKGSGETCGMGVIWIDGDDK